MRYEKKKFMRALELLRINDILEPAIYRDYTIKHEAKVLRSYKTFLFGSTSNVLKWCLEMHINVLEQPIYFIDFTILSVPERKVYTPTIVSLVN